MVPPLIRHPSPGEWLVIRSRIAEVIFKNKLKPARTPPPDVMLIFYSRHPLWDLENIFKSFVSLPPLEKIQVTVHHWEGRLTASEDCISASRNIYNVWWFYFYFHFNTFVDNVKVRLNIPSSLMYALISNVYMAWYKLCDINIKGGM